MKQGDTFFTSRIQEKKEKAATDKKICFFCEWTMRWRALDILLLRRQIGFAHLGSNGSGGSVARL